MTISYHEYKGLAAYLRRQDPIIPKRRFLQLEHLENFPVAIVRIMSPFLQ